jgi:hypothetical protein
MRTFLLLVVASFAIAAPAAAQDAASFVPTTSNLRVGAEVYVVVDAPCTPQGCAGEWVQGRITHLTPTSLGIDDGSVRHELATGQIQLVSRPGDSVWNGVGKGAVFGFLGGFLPPALTNCDGGCIISPLAAGLALGGIGAGIGALIGGLADLSVKGERTIWERTRANRTRASVAPVIGRHAAGFQVRMRF